MGDFDLIDASERSLIDLLLRREAISREHLTDALEYQCRLPHSEYVSLDQILVDMEYLNPRELFAAKQLLGLNTSDSGAARRSQLPGSEAQPIDFAALFGDEASPEPIPGGLEIPGLRPEDLLVPENLVPDLAALFDAPAPADLASLFDSAPDSSTSQVSSAMAVLFDDPSAPLAPPAPSTPPAAVPPPAAVAPPAPVAPPVPPASVEPPAAAMPQGVRAAGAFAQRSMQPPAGNWGAAPPASRPAPPAVRPAPPGVPISSTLPVQPLPDPKLPRPQLGEILLKNHDLEEWQLTHALCIQRAAPQTTPKLGTLLVRLGYVEPQAVERALGSQKS